jgi:hypothetical protein
MLAGLVLLALCSGGCVEMENLVASHDGPPTGKPSQVHVAWHNQVIFAPDPVRGGVNSPGLAGRLYLFGPNMGYPLAGDGSIIVDLFDPTQKGADGEPKHLERWNLDKDTLQRCLRHDTIGWGYTLLLPWGTYKPDLAQIVLRVRYDLAKGAPIYANPATITFNPVKDLQVSSSSRQIGTPPKPGEVVQAKASELTQR